VQRDSSVTMNNEQSKAEHNVIVCDDAPELINAQSASESMLKHVKFSDLSVFSHQGSGCSLAHHTETTRETKRASSAYDW